MNPPSLHIMGARIHAVDPRAAAYVIDGWVAARQREYVVLTGAHGIVEMQTDPELRDINNAAGLTTPDGMPTVWVARLRGHRGVAKTSGPDLMREVFARGVGKGYRHYFYGGGEGTAERLVRALERAFPGMVCAGVEAPPFRPLRDDEEAEVARRIDAARPDVVWVGLGCPKQDRWMHRFRPRLEAPVLVGVGAAFDHLSGEKPLAPEWLRHSGFEWLQRLVTEPRRLWPRYSRVVPKFLAGVAVEELRRLAGR